MFYIFPKAVPVDICNQIIKDCKQNILEEATVIDFENDGNLRKTSVNFISDKNNKINELAWNFLREANEKQFHYDLKYFQPIQFAEYSLGAFYNWHQDQGGPDSSNEIRKLSLTLVLSDPNSFKGCNLEFYSGNRPIKDMGKISGEQIKKDIQSQGTAVVFDSSDWHRVWPPITEGVRHSIVCWTIGPNFK